MRNDPEGVVASSTDNHPDFPVDWVQATHAISEGNHTDPFSVLGPHSIVGRWTITCFVPDAENVFATDFKGELIAHLKPTTTTHVFAGRLESNQRPPLYRLNAQCDTRQWQFTDPYQFSPVLDEQDEYLINEGTHLRLWQVLGAQLLEHQGYTGVRFSVWAPTAKQVSVVGDFNDWDGRRHVMRSRGSTGVWEIFIPGVAENSAYKYQIKNQGGDTLPLKSDPVGFGAEHPPATASVVRNISNAEWTDQVWMKNRHKHHRVDAPISIYEVHLGSWRRSIEDGNRRLSYLELADELIPYVIEMGFSHIELMPITEYPFDGSWGYQPIGLFAPTIRHGTPDEFRAFINACHNANLGVILDWVPAHFPTDAHGLSRFDGQALYEHEDPREGFHHDWNTLIYNYGRREVSNFLIANALFWLHEYHLDGIRVDAVASMLYRDYSRPANEWIPNHLGGRENLEAVAFIKRLNEVLYAEDDSIITVAEESTSWPGVTTPTHAGGLGFGYKWNMGWMNDTLAYMGCDPINRKYHHHQMTFGLLYAFSENFILPLSHDEVVHGKGSLLSRMPGGNAEQFSNLRAYYGFMWGHPGKKLLFMGQDFAQRDEWNHDQSLDWHLLDNPQHAGIQNLIQNLNKLYREVPALHHSDRSIDGFEWLEANATDISVYAWIRQTENAAPVVVVCNLTPVERSGFRVGVPKAGQWIERLNTNTTDYGGDGRGNNSITNSSPVSWNNQDNSIEIILAPLTTLFFEWSA